MSAKREDRATHAENQARRELDHLSRRWPTDVRVYVVLVIVAVIVLVVLAI